MSEIRSMHTTIEYAGEKYRDVRDGWPALTIQLNVEPEPTADDVNLNLTVGEE